MKFVSYRKILCKILFSYGVWYIDLFTYGRQRNWALTCSIENILIDAAFSRSHHKFSSWFIEMCLLITYVMHMQTPCNITHISVHLLHALLEQSWREKKLKKFNVLIDWYEYEINNHIYISFINFQLFNIFSGFQGVLIRNTVDIIEGCV